MQGVPFHFDQTLRATYEGGLLGLLNPFALLCGLVSVTMLIMQGAAWLSVKSEGDVAIRARRYGAIAAILLVLLISVAGLWTLFGVEGYRIAGAIDYAGPSNPLAKTVTREAGAWLDNYRAYRWMIAAPAAAYAGALIAALALAFAARRTALLVSSLSVAGVVTMAGFSMFPFLLPSSSHPSQSLTVWDASSSKATLSLMLVAVIVFPADRSRLHELGLLRAARRRERGGDPSRRRLLLLSGRKRGMWYFSWILGLGLACAFAILNAMWLELDDDDRQK